jgi:hypothetical protein
VSAKLLPNKQGPYILYEHQINIYFRCASVYQDSTPTFSSLYIFKLKSFSHFLDRDDSYKRNLSAHLRGPLCSTTQPDFASLARWSLSLGNVL